MIHESFLMATLPELANRSSHPNTCNIPTYTFWYLATPYAKYAEGKDAAYKAACHYTHDLIRANVPVFSPIAHSHSIATVCEMDKDNHALWMPQDLAILFGAHGVLIAPMAGWRNSVGIEMEVNEAKRLGKPVYLLDVHW